MAMRYALPLLLLIVTPIVFFALAGGRYRQFGVGQLLLRVVVALPLLLSGTVLHFLRTQDSMSIIPPGFPDPRFLVLLSGVLEVLGAIGLFLPYWRRKAGFLLTLMMIAVFPANIFAAGKLVGGLQMPGIPVRTAMQVVFILLILLASFGLPGGKAEPQP